MDSKENVLTLELPDGRRLTARLVGDDIYPGIGIFSQNPDGNEELLCFAEHNTSKPEGLELCVAAYTETEEDVVYYASYNLREPYVKP